MERDPLAWPGPDSPVLRLFLDHFGLTHLRSGRDAARGPCLTDPIFVADPSRELSLVAQAFSTIPYENLSKVVVASERGRVQDALRGPAEVLSDHIRTGSGGTCFSLTAALLHVLRALGWSAQPVLADRKYGAETHCALVADLAGTPHLLDPGYLIVQPLPLFHEGERRFPTPFNELVLRAQDNGRTLELWTAQSGRLTYRLTYKTDPCDSGAFLRAWAASFEWEMMCYPVLTQVRDGRQLYLQANRLQIRDQHSVQRLELDPEQLPARIAHEFGLAPAMVQQALELWRRQGEAHGRAAAG